MPELVTSRFCCLQPSLLGIAAGQIFTAGVHLTPLSRSQEPGFVVGQGFLDVAIEGTGPAHGMW